MNLTWMWNDESLREWQRQLRSGDPRDESLKTLQKIPKKETVISKSISQEHQYQFTGEPFKKNAPLPLLTFPPHPTLKRSRILVGKLWRMHREKVSF